MFGEDGRPEHAGLAPFHSALEGYSRIEALYCDAAL